MRNKYQYLIIMYTHILTCLLLTCTSLVYNVAKMVSVEAEGEPFQITLGDTYSVVHNGFTIKATTGIHSQALPFIQDGLTLPQG